MVNWHDPVLVLRDYRMFPQSIPALLAVALTARTIPVVVIKLDHALGGLYLFVHATL